MPTVKVESAVGDVCDPRDMDLPTVNVESAVGDVCDPHDMDLPTVEVESAVGDVCLWTKEQWWDVVAQCWQERRVRMLQEISNDNGKGGPQKVDGKDGQQGQAGKAWGTRRFICTCGGPIDIC